MSEQLLPNVQPTGGATSPAITRRPATAAVLVGVLLGMLGDWLFRAPRPGINVLLWAAGAVAGLAWVARLRGRPVSAGSWALAVPVLFFASAFLWRDAELLLVMNVLAMLSAFGVLALAVSGWPRDVTRASTGEFILGGASLGVSGAFGAPVLLTADRALADGGARPRWRVAMAVARGVLIALPVLVVFGALLSSADPKFERLLAQLIDIDFAETIGHIMFAGFIAWVAAGYMRAGAVADRPLGLSNEWHAPRLSLGIAELATVLGLIDVLFLLFVALQLPHFFGGAARVQQTAGLTVAEYARGGFFELVAVAALVLPVLLAAAALVRRDVPREWATFRGLTAAMLVLVGLMVVSALQRLTLYVANFGLSEDRVYATSIVIWLAIVFALFVVTVLRRRSARFAFAAIASGWVVLAALDVANPQALVAKTNLDRAARGASFDWMYAASLSADAVPALAAGVTKLDAEARCGLAYDLLDPASREAEALSDWRSWNLPQSRASAAAREAVPRSIIATCPARTALLRPVPAPSD